MIFLELSTEEAVHILVDPASAVSRKIASIATDLIVRVATEIRYNRPVVSVICGGDHTFLHVVTRRNPVGKGKQALHELRSDNQSREKVIEANKNTRQDLSRCHGPEKADKGLTEVRIDGNIECEESLSQERKSGIYEFDAGLEGSIDEDALCNTYPEGETSHDIAGIRRKTNRQKEDTKDGRCHEDEAFFGIPKRPGQ